MAKKDFLIVDIPQVDDADAYDPDRPISSLVRTQLLHLHHAEQIAIPKNKQTNTNINHLLTERQASEYIAAITALLHQYGESRAGAASKPKKKIGKRSPSEAMKRKTRSPASNKKTGAKKKKRAAATHKKRR
jgi:hypothetical protein